MATRDPCRTPRKPIRAWPRRFWGLKPQCSKILFKKVLPIRRLCTYNSNRTKYWRSPNKFQFSPNRRRIRNNHLKRHHSWYNKFCNSQCSMHLYRAKHSLRHFRIVCRHNKWHLSLICLKCGGRYLI